MVVNRRRVQRKDSITIDRESGRKSEPDSIFSIDALRPHFAAMFFRNRDSYACVTVLARTRFVDSIKALENKGAILPPVEAPIATTTGWALRRAGFSENEGCEANGQHIPFKTIKAERRAAGNPRHSLEERYKDHEGYVKEVAKAARKLERHRFLLAEDVQKYIDEAQASNVLLP